MPRSKYRCVLFAPLREYYHTSSPVGECGRTKHRKKRAVSSMQFQCAVCLVGVQTNARQVINAEQGCLSMATDDSHIGQDMRFGMTRGAGHNVVFWYLALVGPS